LKWPPRKSLRINANNGMAMTMSKTHSRAMFGLAAKANAFHTIQLITAKK
jgi:hypothetical protein